MPQHTCRRCCTTKPLAEFARDKSKASGHKSLCKQCDNDKSRRYYEQSKRTHTHCCYCDAPTAGDRFCNLVCQDAHAWERRKPPIVIAPRPCKHCGQPFARLSSSTSAYCSPEHKAAAYRAKDLERYHQDAEASRRAQRDRYTRARLLDLAAGLAQWQPVDQPLALMPGPPIRRGRPRLRTQRRRGIPTPWTAGYCRECGTGYVVPRAGARQVAFCLETCSKRNRRRRDKQARSKRIKAGARRETIDLAVLAKRDGWRCHLCDRKVDRTNWSHDHLIPLSAGGDHTYDNVALAHTLCNSKRGTGPAQLRLAA